MQRANAEVIRIILKLEIFKLEILKLEMLRLEMFGWEMSDLNGSCRPPYVCVNVLQCTCLKVTG